MSSRQTEKTLLSPIPPTFIARPNPVGTGIIRYTSNNQESETLASSLKKKDQKNRVLPPRPPGLLTENAQAFHDHLGSAVRCELTYTV